jgi:hypothetical protein
MLGAIDGHSRYVENQHSQFKEAKYEETDLHDKQCDNINPTGCGNEPRPTITWLVHELEGQLIR